MKKILFYIITVLACSNICSCQEKKPQTVKDTANNKVAVKDTAIYGVCTDEASMHSLSLLTDDDRKLVLNIDPTGDEPIVLGGIMNGDKMTASFFKSEEGLMATKVINVTTLVGKWTSLDRNFEIMEDGTVQSFVKSESKPYTSWSMCNCNLILNEDTFAVLSLGADSLELENRVGIFVYKRQ